MRSAWIVGSGPNKKEIPENVDLIAVNEEMHKYPNAKYLITLDYAGYAGKRLNFKGIKIFILCLHDYVKDGEIIKDTRFNITYNLSEYDWVIKSRTLHGLGQSLKDFRNNGNSGLSAFQFALGFGYKEIHLCGIEMLGVYSPFFELIRDDLREFKSKFPEVSIHNHCETSALREYFGYEE